MLSTPMTYRDGNTVLRDRIDQLELQLARTAGRAIALHEERDALREKLERLTGDPQALARKRRTMDRRSAFYVALRVLGALTLGVAAAPMLVVMIVLLAEGELGFAAMCAVIPAVIMLGAFALKLPEILQALELRFERRLEERRARARATQLPRVRVAIGDESEPPRAESQAEREAARELRR